MALFTTFSLKFRDLALYLLLNENKRCHTLLHLVLVFDIKRSLRGVCWRVLWSQRLTTGIWLPHTQIHHNLVHFLHPQIPLLLGVGTQPVSAQRTGLWVQSFTQTSEQSHPCGGTDLVTHMVLVHWLTSVSLSSSLWALTVISSNVLGRAQNSLLTASTFLLEQFVRLMRPMGFWQKNDKPSELLHDFPLSWWRSLQAWMILGDMLSGPAVSSPKANWS